MWESWPQLILVWLGRKSGMAAATWSGARACLCLTVEGQNLKGEPVQGEV